MKQHQNNDPEYEEVPPSTKSKYSFNSQRLRLAQGSLPSSPTIDSPTSKAVRSPSRPPLVRSKSLSYLRNTSKRPRKKGLVPGNDHLSTADAQWYLSLPSKLQRRHFTEDEQLILAGHCTSVALGVRREKPLLQSARSHSTLRPSTSSSSSSETSLYFEAPQEPADSDSDMDDAMMEKLQWMDNDEIDLRLDEYHTHIIEASSARQSWSSHRRPSYHRNLTSPILPSSSGSQAISQKPSSIRAPTPTKATFPATSPASPATNNRETFNFLPIHQNRISTDSSIATHYYQDPEARLKLRMYFASASKFDEAIEYGFGSLSSDEKDSHRDSTFPIQRPSLSSHHYPTAPATFFDDSSPSVFNAFECPEDESDKDGTSLPDLDVPRTPNDATVFRNTHRLPTTSSSMASFAPPPVRIAPINNNNSKSSSQRPSFDCPTELQTSLKPKIRYLAPVLDEREMTLRMTLTRPDLRREVYGEEGDPLALEELPRPVNGRTLWDEPPKRVGRVRRFVMRVSGRTCQS